MAADRRSIAEARNDAGFLQYSLPPEALDTQNWDENNMHTDNVPRGPVECDIRKLIRPRRRQRESLADPPRQRGLRELNPNLTHTNHARISDGSIECKRPHGQAEVAAEPRAPPSTAAAPLPAAAPPPTTALLLATARSPETAPTLTTALLLATARSPETAPTLTTALPSAIWAPVQSEAAADPGCAGGVPCEAGEAVARPGTGRGTGHGAAGQGEAAAAPGCGHGIAHEGDEAAGDPGCARSVEAAGRGADANAVTADVVADATTDATADAMTDAMTDDERFIVEQLFDDCIDSEWRDLWASDYAGCAKCNGYIFRSSDVADQVCAAALDRVRLLLTCCAPRAHAAWRLLLRHRS